MRGGEELWMRTSFPFPRKALGGQRCPMSKFSRISLEARAGVPAAHSRENGQLYEHGDAAVSSRCAVMALTERRASSSTAAGAVAGVPLLEGGSGAYTMRSWMAWAASSP